MFIFTLCPIFSIMTISKFQFSSSYVLYNFSTISTLFYFIFNFSKFRTVISIFFFPSYFNTVAHLHTVKFRNSFLKSSYVPYAAACPFVSLLYYPGPITLVPITCGPISYLVQISYSNLAIILHISFYVLQFTYDPAYSVNPLVHLCTRRFMTSDLA